MDKAIKKKSKIKMNILLVLIMVFTTIISPKVSFAYNDRYTGNYETVVNYEEYAKILQTLGIFKGTDAGFELDRQATRVEAAIMLVRLLGLEQHALEKKLSHPFNDVPNWASPYVGYLYQEKLTSGTSATTFGSNNFIDANSYFTFVLRVLGYDDRNGDFKWNQSVDFALKNKIISNTDYKEFTSGLFYRKNLAKSSFIALKSHLKNTDRLLADKLIDNGVINSEIASALGILDVYDKKDIYLDSFLIVENSTLMIQDKDSLQPTIIDKENCNNRYVLKVDGDTIYYMTVISGDYYLRKGEFYHNKFYSINKDGKDKKLLKTVEGRMVGDIVQDGDKIYMTMITSRKDDDAYFQKWEATSLYSINYDGSQLTEIAGPIQLSLRNIKVGNMIYTETSSDEGDSFIHSISAIDIEKKKIYQIKYNYLKYVYHLLDADEKYVYYMAYENKKFNIYRADKDLRNPNLIDTVNASNAIYTTYFNNDTMLYVDMTNNFGIDRNGQKVFKQKLILRNKGKTVSLNMPIIGFTRVIGRVGDRIYVSVVCTTDIPSFFGYVDLNTNKLVEIFTTSDDYIHDESYRIVDQYIYYTRPTNKTDSLWRYNVNDGTNEIISNYNLIPKNIVNIYK